MFLIEPHDFMVCRFLIILHRVPPHWFQRHEIFRILWVQDCEHPSTPRQKKLVRVGFFRSGWRIRKGKEPLCCSSEVLSFFGAIFPLQ